MENLDKRVKRIMNEILSFNEPVTSEYLAKIVGVTSRTIRNDIKALNLKLKKIGVEIEAIRGVGYFIDPKQKVQMAEPIKELFLHEEDQQITPVLPEERVFYILKRIIMADGFITIEQLANELYVSKSTVDNDLKRVEQLLNRYHIDLFKKPNYGIKMIGNEMDIRFCLSDSLAKFKDAETQPELSHVNYEFISEDDIERIREITKDHVKKLPFSMADLPLNNLVIHIAIAIERIKKGKSVEDHSIAIDQIDGREYKVAQQIVHSLESNFSIEIPSGEISYITIHLLGAKHFENELGVQQDFIELIGKSNHDLVRAILLKIKAIYQVDLLDDQELVYGLGLHLRSAVNRINYRMNLRNPMLDQIKQNYPFSFELAIVAAEVIQKERNLLANEDEIGYIALHLEAALGRMENKKRREVKRVAIVCASGIGTAKLLETSIKGALPGLEIVGTYPTYTLKNIKREEVDLILSTIPIKEDTPVPALHINPILTKKDLEKIKTRVSGEVIETDDDTKVARLEKLFSSDLFFPELRLDSSEDVIKTMSAQLVRSNLVDSSFQKSVLDREGISPTALGNLVAIPHPLTPNASSSNIAIGILKRPIKWGEQSVQIVFLLALNKNEKDEFSHLFTHLWELVQNKRLIDELCSISDFTLFMERFFQG